MKVTINGCFCLIVLVGCFALFHFATRHTWKMPEWKKLGASLVKVVRKPAREESLEGNTVSETTLGKETPPAMAGTGETGEDLNEGGEDSKGEGESEEGLGKKLADPDPAAVTSIEPRYPLILPTDNEKIFEDPPAFYMHTNRWEDGVNLKLWRGGKYGFVRNKLTTQIGIVFTRLHEGIDVRPVERDEKGNPLDEVKAISEGVVAYVNPESWRSNYGKYVVIRHEWEEGDFFTLYAHLATTEVSTGMKVSTGTSLGLMGYTGSGLDRERAHLHMELAFMLSERFSEYSPDNVHDNYNGQNLIGIDIGRFYEEHQKNPRLSVKEFLSGEEPYFKVRLATSERPCLLRRHPWLEEKGEVSDDDIKGWEITFARSGVPLSMARQNESSDYARVTWVKTVDTNHSYMTQGRLSGMGGKAKLSSKGHRYIQLISDTF